MNSVVDSSSFAFLAPYGPLYLWLATVAEPALAVATIAATAAKAPGPGCLRSYMDGIRIAEKVRQHAPA